MDHPNRRPKFMLGEQLRLIGPIPGLWDWTDALGKQVTMGGWVGSKTCLIRLVRKGTMYDLYIPEDRLERIDGTSQ